MTLEDPHRPFVDDVEIPSPTGGEPLRRVPEVIDVWFDSGSMPFAQWHAPFENQDKFERAVPRRLHLRGDRPDPRLVLQPDRDLDAAVRPELLQDRALPRPHRRSRGQEDVEVARQHRRAVGRHRPPRRGRLPLVLPDQQAAVGRLPVQRRHGRRVAAPVPAAALEHVRLLRAVRERQRRRAAPTSSPRTTSTAGRCRGWPRRSRRSPSAWTTTTRPAAARRSRRSSTISPTGTSAARAAASGTATRPRSRPCARCLVTVTQLLAPFTPFVADEIYDNLDGTEPSVHLTDWPKAGRARRGPRVRDGDRPRDRPARPGGARPGQAQGPPAAARRRGRRRRRRARRDRAPAPTSRSRSSTSRSCATSRRPTSSAPTRSSPTTARSARASASRCRRSRPRSPRSTRSTSPTRCATAAASAISIDGHDHELGADDLLLAMKPLEGYQLEREGSHAVALELELDDELRREGLAREIVHAIQNARKTRRPAGRGPDRAAARRRRRAAARPRASTRPTWPARRSRPSVDLRRRGGRRAGDDRGPAAPHRRQPRGLSRRCRDAATVRQRSVCSMHAA